MINKPKGTRDFFGDEIKKIEELENVFRSSAKKYGFDEIKTPTFEKTSLFKRGVGESSDIVTKEMFEVISTANLIKYKNDDYDLSKKGTTLRPEGTAPVVRACIENNLFANTLPIKLFYTLNCFRNERPQAGRFREFTQYGVEVFGSDNAFTDSEVIALANDIVKSMSIIDYTIYINTIGCIKCRNDFEKELKQFLKENLEELCFDCNNRFEKNPLRMLDCKNDKCKEKMSNHPIILDYVCDECSTHFDELKDNLDALGVEYEVDPNVVRGLDYYTKTAFEIKTNLLGSQSAICAGGRYDGLVESLDGPKISGVGFGLGMDRVIMAADKSGHFNYDDKSNGIFIINMTDNKLYSVSLLKSLRDLGLYTQIDHLDRSLKSAFKYASKMNFKHVIIIGEDEIKKNELTLKILDTSEQIKNSVENILEFLKRSYYE